MCSSSRTVPSSFFLLASLESIRAEHVRGILSMEELKKAQLDDHFVQYKPAIVINSLFSFLRFTGLQAYLSIIDKRSNSFSEVQRYNFYGLLDVYRKGRVVASAPTLRSEQTKTCFNLRNVLLKPGHAVILDFLQLHTDYDDSQDWWMRRFVYELILAPYQDSNNDGIGDIQGLK